MKARSDGGGRKRKRSAIVTCCMIMLAMTWSAVALADDAALLDVLRQKQVITPQEYQRLKGTELPPEQREGLIELLREKGVLTPDEATRLGAAPPAPPEAAKPVPPATTPQFGYERKGFYLRTRDAKVRLRFKGSLFADSRFLEPGTTQTNRVSIERARLGIDARFYRYFRIQIENEFTDDDGLRDAFIAVTPMPEANAKIGQFKVPFSFEALRSKKYIDFIERSPVVESSVDPFRDIGVMLYGEFANELLQYQLAGMNGAGQNDKDNNSDKDVIGRLVVTPLANGGPELLRSFNLGGAVTYGHQPIDKKSDTSSIEGETETGFTFYPAVARHGERLRWGVHGAWLYGPFSLSSEYIQTSEARDGLGEDGSDLPALDTEGAYLSGTWLLTGDTKAFDDRIYPSRRLWDWENPGRGAWEVALRYEYYKLRHGAGRLPKGEVDPALDNRYDAIVAGINWYPNEFLRFSVNYLYGHFERRGKSLSPNPDKHSNNAVLGRAQLQF